MEGVTIPAHSRSQQRLFGWVHAIQQGKAKAPSGHIADIAQSISKTDAKHFASTKHTGLPERKEAMEGEKKAVTRRSWDDARFESVVGALGKVKVPKQKKPQMSEESPVKQAADPSQLQATIEKIKKYLGSNGASAALAGGGAALGLGALGAGASLAPTGAVLGAAYGAGQAPDKQKIRGAAQGVLPGAGAGAGLGVGAVGGLGAGSVLGALLAEKLKDKPGLAAAAGIGSALAGTGVGAAGGMMAGKGLGKGVSNLLLGKAVDRAEPELKTAGCGGKKKKKSKKGK
jgi:hypothetical protein